MGIIRVIICDDDLLFVQLVKNMLEKTADIRVMDTAYSLKDLERKMQTQHFDVLLMDIMLSEEGTDGLEGALYMSRKNKKLSIIMLTGLDVESVVEEALGVGGAVNLLHKPFVQDLPDAIRAAALRRSSIHHSAAEALRRRLSKRKSEEVRRQLSDTQIEILRLLDQGLSRKEIAKKLFFSEQTINNELCKATAAIKGKFPYLEWLRIKKHKTKEIVELAKEIMLI